jgi:hypothetical protein
MPGAVYIVEEKECVLTGQQNYGRYLLFKYDIVDEKGKAKAVKAEKCKLLYLNKGLVFVS